MFIKSHSQIHIGGNQESNIKSSIFPLKLSSKLHIQPKYCTFDNITKINVTSSFNYISYRLTLFATLVLKGNSFFYSYLKIVSFVAAPASFECFTFFLLRLSDLDDSAIIKFCFEYFAKDVYLSKNVVLKKKPIVKFILFVHREKKYQEIIKINITKLLI